MSEKKEKWINILTLAFTTALLPPIWAVVSPYFGVTVGAVALICAGLYVAAGNEKKKAVPISLGLLCGDIWAVITLMVQETMSFNPNVELYITLFIMGGLAVIIGSVFERWIFVPSWLCGWAIGLTIMGPLGISSVGSLPLQIGVAMLAGVWYVGVVGDIFQRLLILLIKKNK